MVLHVKISNVKVLYFKILYVKILYVKISNVKVLYFKILYVKISNKCYCIVLYIDIIYIKYNVLFNDFGMVLTVRLIIEQLFSVHHNTGNMYWLNFDSQYSGLHQSNS